MNTFKMEERDAGHEMRLYRKAEEEVFSELLDNMALPNGKIPLFKGGRFSKKEGVQKLNLDVNQMKTAEEVYKT